MTDSLTTAQAAAALHVGAAHIRRLCLRGQLPGAEHWGRDWRIPQGAIDTYKAAGHKPGHPPAPRPPAAEAGEGGT